MGRFNWMSRGLVWGILVCGSMLVEHAAAKEAHLGPLGAEQKSTGQTSEMASNEHPHKDLLRRVVGMRRTGHADQAIAELDQAIERDPYAGELFAARARCWMEKKDPNWAQADASRALSLDSSLTEAHCARCWAWFTFGEYQSALLDATAMIEQQKDRSTGYEFRAVCHYCLGQYRESIADLERALTREPIPETRMRLAGLLAACPDRTLRNGQRAIKLLEQGSREASGNDEQWLSALAAAYAECGDFDQAVATQARAIDLGRPVEGRCAMCLYWLGMRPEMFFFEGLLKVLGSCLASGLFVGWPLYRFVARPLLRRLFGADSAKRPDFELWRPIYA